MEEYDEVSKIPQSVFDQLKSRLKALMEEGKILMISSPTPGHNYFLEEFKHYNESRNSVFNVAGSIRDFHLRQDVKHPFPIPTDYEEIELCKRLRSDVIQRYYQGRMDGRIRESFGDWATRGEFDAEVDRDRGRVDYYQEASRRYAPTSICEIRGIKAMRAAIIVDIDGTIANEIHRHCNQDVKVWGPKEYDEFYKNINKDGVYDWCRRMVRMYLEQRFKIIFITGRPEKYRVPTVKWLFEKVGLNPNAHYELYMRPDGDFRCDTEIKKEIYHNKVEGIHDVEFVLEDRRKVCDMWRSLGLTCLQVAEGNY